MNALGFALRISLEQVCLKLHGCHCKNFSTGQQGYFSRIGVLDQQLINGLRPALWIAARNQKHTGFHLRQKAGVNNTRMVNISSRPNSMAKEYTQVWKSPRLA